MVLAAAIQMQTGSDRIVNEGRALALLDAAADRGAVLAMLPEMWEHIGPAKQKAEFAGPLEGRQLHAIRELCVRRSLWCLAGSIAEKALEKLGETSGAHRFHNTSALISPEGKIVASYRKLHLFDVDIPDGAHYRESEQVAEGQSVPPVVALGNLGLKLGLSVCYDLRFPELYRKLSEQGADLVAVPAAFTAYTGKAHWQVLLRARAIENQVYLLAPAQSGQIGPPAEQRFAWGHASIIDPWGEVIADAGPDGEGMAFAELDPKRLQQVRRDLPSLANRRRDIFG